MSQTYKSWVSDVEKPFEIDLDAFKFMVDQAKELFEDHKTTSETITGRAMRLLVIYVSAIAAIIGYFFVSPTDKPELNSFQQSLVVVFLISIVICIYFLVTLMFPREEIKRGSSPSEMIIKSIFTSNTAKEYSAQAIYLTELQRLETKILHTKTTNENRIRNYRNILIASLIIVVGLAAFATTLL